jgi:hypothetical protein
MFPNYIMLCIYRRMLQISYRIAKLLSGIDVIISRELYDTYFNSMDSLLKLRVHSS